MGVPGLWPFIKMRYGKAIYHFHRNSRKYNFDYVYLDANGLLHNAAQVVENYGEKKRNLNKYATLTSEERRLKIFELFFENIIQVVSVINPTKALYIAIDGPAPRAKQAQQRERRFVAAQLRKIENENDNSFNSSCITPGTEFMHELSKFMFWKIRDAIQSSNENSFWKKITVIYSPPTVGGEGEHKILDYIRSLPDFEKEKATHCMFGPDGDLLMLTLSAHINQMFLFREDNDCKRFDWQPEFVDLVDTKFIKQGLSYDLNPCSFNRNFSGEHNNFIDENIINDFIFIGFFVGNDFLPKIKMFHKLKDGLSMMYNVYNHIKKDLNFSYLTNNNLIILSFLKKFIFELSKYESNYITEQASVVVTDKIFLDNTLLSCINTIIEGEVQFKILHMPNYRQKYYAKAGIEDTAESSGFFEENVAKMCKDYLRNLIWVYKYYVEKLPSWHDSYTWHYAPLMIDLYKYINNLSGEDLEEISTFENQNNPALPFEQLLSVLPSSLAFLLPEYYRSLMIENNSSLVKAGYYPEKFDIDYEGKYQSYQGIAMLPFVEYEVVSKAYREHDKKSKFKYHRNIPGKLSTFKFCEDYCVNFQSEYGEIKKCRVKVF